MNIPRPTITIIDDRDVKCVGVYALKKKRRGNGYIYYLDNAESPSNKSIVFLIYHVIFGEFYVTDGYDIWNVSEEISGWTPKIVTENVSRPCGLYLPQIGGRFSMSKFLYDAIMDSVKAYGDDKS